MSTDNNDKKKTGRIYQLVNMITNEIYVGATLQTLHKRQYDRKRYYNTWLKGKSQFSDSHKLFDNIYKYGWECFRCELLAEVEVSNKAELHKIEGDWIRKLDTYNNGLNGAIPQRDIKQYYQENKDELVERQKKYYQDNKDTIAKQNKQYRQNNKDKITKWNKQYQKNNKNKIANIRNNIEKIIQINIIARSVTILHLSTRIT